MWVIIIKVQKNPNLHDRVWKSDCPETTDANYQLIHELIVFNRIDRLTYLLISGLFPHLRI